MSNLDMMTFIYNIYNIYIINYTIANNYNNDKLINNIYNINISIIENNINYITKLINKAEQNIYINKIIYIM